MRVRIPLLPPTRKNNVKYLVLIGLLFLIACRPGGDGRQPVYFPPGTYITEEVLVQVNPDQSGLVVEGPKVYPVACEGHSLGLLVTYINGDKEVFEAPQLVGEVFSYSYVEIEVSL